MTTRPTPETPERLVEQHLPLVKHIALGLREQIPSDLELDDLISWGVQGMLEAAERFDPRRGAAFSTFAYYRIRGGMIDGLRASGRLPRNEIHRLRMLERADDYLENASARESGADPAALGRRSTTDVLGQISEHLSSVTTIYVMSLESKPGFEVADESASAPFDRLEASGLGPHLTEALESLDEQERKLVSLCYFGDLSLKDAGDELGVSRSWASRIHLRAIRKLQLFFSARDRAVPRPAPLEAT